MVPFSAQPCKGFRVYQIPVGRLNTRACDRVTKWQGRQPEAQSQNNDNLIRTTLISFEDGDSPML